MKKCIVTGGAGFIGSNLVEKLIKLNFRVNVIDNLSTGLKSNLKDFEKKINFYEKDISDIDQLDNIIFKDVDYIFHLAGLADIVPSIENPEKYFKSNVLGTFNVLQKCKNHKIKKFIYAASASCYGIPKVFPISENCEIMTEYPYALTKNLGEQIVTHWAKVYNIPFISLRFFNAYGQRSRTTGAYGAMFGVFLAQKLNNLPLTIVGDGNQTRDFIHVNDLIEDETYEWSVTATDGNGGSVMSPSTTFYPTNIQERPVVYKGEICIRKMILFGICFDHFIVDGGYTLKACQHLKTYIENPDLILGPVDE